MNKKRILILAGTTEARQLADRLCLRGEFAVTLSLAGRTLHPSALPAPTRVGGFGGVDGLTDYLRREAIDLLIDATHPFANRISQNAIGASKRLGLPFLKVERPAWQRQAGDRWTSVHSIEEAVRALGDAPLRVFLATGRQEADAANAAPQHHYVVRSVDPVEPRLAVPSIEYILTRGPFTFESEYDLLKTKRIDVIICKNSGGDATYAKLEAARNLGLAVLMIERGERDAVLTASSPDAAVDVINHIFVSMAKRGV